MKHAITQFLCFVALVMLPLIVQGQEMPSVFSSSRSIRAFEHLRLAKGAAVYRSEQTITQYNDQLNWINEKRTINHYQGGLIRRQIEESWEGHVFGEWMPVGQTDFLYAHDGTLATETYFVTADSALVPASRILYDSQNGVFLEIVEQEFQDGNWFNLTRESFTIASDLITGGLTEVWVGDWRASERFIVEQVGNDVVETVQVADADDWINSERRIYENLTIGGLYELVNRMTSDFLDYAGLWYSIRVPDATEQQWVDDRWANVSRSVSDRFFDLMTGNLVEEITTIEDWVGAGWRPVTMIDTEYSRPPNTVGAPARTTIRTYGNDEWIDLFVEKYIIQSDILRIVQATVETDMGDGFVEVTRVLIDWVNTGGLASEPGETPGGFALAQNTPNPFNPSTRISFQLDQAQQVRLVVYDMVGREVAVLDSGLRPAGEHFVRWEAGGLPSGTYLYRLEAAGASETRSMVLLK